MAGSVGAAAISPDGSRVVGVCEDGKTRVWDTRTGKELLVLKGVALGGADRASFSLDGAQIVTTGRAARVWDARSGVLLRRFEEADGKDSFSPAARKIYTAGDRLRVWDARTGTELPPLPGKAGRSPPVAFSADGSTAVTLDGRTARVWGTKTGSLISSVPGHSENI